MECPSHSRRLSPSRRSYSFNSLIRRKRIKESELRLSPPSRTKSSSVFGKLSPRSFFKKKERRSTIVLMVISDEQTSYSEDTLASTSEYNSIVMNRPTRKDQIKCLCDDNLDLSIAGERTVKKYSRSQKKNV